MENIIEPKFRANYFTCPKCKRHALQAWNIREVVNYNGYYCIGGIGRRTNIFVSTSTCQNCGKGLLWANNNIVNLDNDQIEDPSQDMPLNVKEIYNEARKVYSLSSKGAAALLRLGTQLLCIDLGEKGKNINADIKNLVKNGLPENVKKAFDIIRISGNEAVHPGELYLEGNSELTKQLFASLNYIVEELYTSTTRFNNLYNRCIIISSRPLEIKKDLFS